MLLEPGTATVEVERERRRHLCRRRRRILVLRRLWRAADEAHQHLGDRQQLLLQLWALVLDDQVVAVHADHLAGVRLADKLSEDITAIKLLR